MTCCGEFLADFEPTAEQLGDMIGLSELETRAFGLFLDANQEGLKAAGLSSRAVDNIVKGFNC